jgi:hypothetical protein
MTTSVEAGSGALLRHLHHEEGLEGRHLHHEEELRGEEAEKVLMLLSTITIFQMIFGFEA